MSYSAGQLAEAGRLGAATLHEAAGRIGALPSAIKPVAPAMRIAGPAFTVHVPAGDNLWIHRALYQAVPGDVLVVSTSGLTLGNGLDRATTMGPLANPRRLTAMHDMIADAAATGARLATGGERHAGAGNFWQPTVLADVPDQARLMNEEPFGPVAVTQRFDTFDEVTAQANRLPYGLAAYAWTQSARTAHDIGDALEAGMVGINFVGLTGPETPFGGIKDSGHGSEGGPEGLDPYLNHKYIAQG